VIKASIVIKAWLLRVWLAVEFLLRQEDKRQHFLYSFFLLLLFIVLVPAYWAAVIVFLIGLGKEVWDHYYGSGFCWFDMQANLMGIFLGLLVWPLF